MPERPSERRSAARTSVVWDALRPVLEGGSDRPALEVLDIGGGTGGFAVRVAELGHRVTVVDPSPDALAILDRRSRETGVAGRVTGLPGHLFPLPPPRADGSLAGADGSDAVDVVLCHGVLEIVDD